MSTNGPPLLIANWKQYVSERVAPKLCASVVRAARGTAWPSDVTLIIAPPLLAMPVCAPLVRDARGRVALCSQDVGFTDEGAYTGAISPRALRAMGVTYALVGHSERREWYKEDDALVRRKCASALAAGLRVILCVGETKDERQEGRAAAVVKAQLGAILTDAQVRVHLDHLIIAYEPRWAIGTGVAIAPEDALTMHRLIRARCGPSVRVCYGGSVDARNARAFVVNAASDGVLVGSASTTCASLANIAKRISYV